MTVSRTPTSLTGGRFGASFGAAEAAIHPSSTVTVPMLEVSINMQCYQYLARHYQARRQFGAWADRYDDLDLAEVLDERRERPFAEGGNVTAFGKVDANSRKQ